MKEEASDSEAEEVLDEGAGVFIKAFDHDIMLESCDDREIERQERENDLEE